MKNEYELFGKDLKKEIIKDSKRKKVEDAVVGTLERDYDEAAQPMDGELEKTPDEIKLISLGNRYIKDELNALGIKKELEIEPPQFHFFSHEEFIKKFGERDANINAIYKAGTNAAFFDKETPGSRLRFYKALLHEMIHIASIHKFYAELKNDNVIVPSYRTGYTITDPRKKEKENLEHFRWLNEAIVDKITMEIINKHQTELRKELKINDEEENESLGSYYPSLGALNELIKELSKRKGESESNIWQKIKRGQFTGEMMHLRDVEKYLGKGELERLAHFGNKK